MNIHLGAPPKAPEVPVGTWRAIREPRAVTFMLLAIPTGFLAAGLIVALWLRVSPVQKMITTEPLVVWLSAALILLIPIHEFIHLVVYPRCGMTKDSMIGIWPSRMLVYAHHTGALSRTRFLAVLAMPLLVMTVLPLLCSVITGHVYAVVFFISVLNTLAAGGDILALAMILWQVPRRTMIQNWGYHTFWQHHDPPGK